MFKNNNYIKVLIVLSFIIIFSGCSLYGPDTETMQIDPPPATLEMDNGNTSTTIDNTTLSNNDNTEQSTVQEEKVNLTIYFFDSKGDVVPLSMDLPKVVGIGQEVLDYMTIGGPAENLLPDGFRPVLPEGTKFSINVKKDEKLAIIDFSKEFLNYDAKSPADEKKILDAITWSITEFPTVDRVEIRVNGYPLEAMPTWNTPIIEPLSRTNGINLELANNINIGQTTPVTLYFDRMSGSNFNYLVPVTRLIPKTDNIAKATLEQLISGPKPGTNLTSSLLPSTKVLDVKVSDNLVVADFDDSLLGFDNQISDKLINMIVWSLTENTHIDSIQIKVMGNDELLPKKLSKPIMKPNTINLTIF